MCRLFLVGYNSSRYDLPAIIREMLSVVDNVADIKVIKQGSTFFSLTYNDISFIDAIKFTSGGSLEKFCRTFGSVLKKTIFPYEFFENYSDLVSCTSWPGMRAFKSSLNKEKIKQEEITEVREFFGSDKEFFDFFQISSIDEFVVSPKQYFDHKVDFNFRIFSGQWKNFTDYLIEYNLNDTKILFEAFSNYIKIFNETFGCQVLSKLSLPGLAEGKSACLIKSTCLIQSTRLI